jgi:hypothetical protein
LPAQYLRGTPSHRKITEVPPGIILPLLLPPSTIQRSTPRPSMSPAPAPATKYYSGSNIRLITTRPRNPPESSPRGTHTTIPPSTQSRTRTRSMPLLFEYSHLCTSQDDACVLPSLRAHVHGH